MACPCSAGYSSSQGHDGLALLPNDLIEYELAHGKLAAINAPALNSEAAYHSVLPEEGVSSPLVDTFATWAAKAVRRH